MKTQIDSRTDWIHYGHVSTTKLKCLAAELQETGEFIFIC